MLSSFLTEKQHRVCWFCLEWDPKGNRVGLGLCKGTNSSLLALLKPEFTGNTSPLLHAFPRTQIGYVAPFLYFVLLSASPAYLTAELQHEGQGQKYYQPTFAAKQASCPRTQGRRTPAMCLARDCVGHSFKQGGLGGHSGLGWTPS